MRYWLIAYILLGIIAVRGFHFLKERYKKLTLLIILALIVTSVCTLLVENESSLMKVATSLKYYGRIAGKIQTEIDQESIIYTDIYDKILSPYGIHVATWWGDEAGYNPEKLIDSMVRVKTLTSYSVYLYSTSSYVNVNELNTILTERNLFLKSNQDIRYLYKLEGKLSK